MVVARFILLSLFRDALIARCVSIGERRVVLPFAVSKDSRNNEIVCASVSRSILKQLSHYNMDSSIKQSRFKTSKLDDTSRLKGSLLLPASDDGDRRQEVWAQTSSTTTSNVDAIKQTQERAGRCSSRGLHNRELTPKIHVVEEKINFLLQQQQQQHHKPR